MTISPHNQKLRARDELILLWIKARCAGQTPKEIAARFGTTADYVRIATREAMSDDIALSNENPATVRAHYWPED